MCTVLCTALSVSSSRAAFPNPTHVVDVLRQSTAFCNSVTDMHANVRLYVSVINFFLVYLEALGNAALVVSRLVGMIAACLPETDPDMVFRNTCLTLRQRKQRDPRFARLD